MDQSGNFRPGRPLNPYFGYSTPARSTDYPIAVNTNIQGRAAWGRVSYETLKLIYDSYDVARMCVNHKIDELRSMPLMFLPAEGVKDDVDDEIEAARLVLKRPDRQLLYGSWLSKWLESAVKYDSAPLYKRRDYNGHVIGLEVVDGKTIFPYIDENGRRPSAEPGQPQPPAYAQIIKGMVGTWFTHEEVIYEPFRPQEDSPFGMAPMETLLFTANTDLRFQWHFLQLFTDGSVPAGFMEVPPDISSPDQVAEWQDYWDAMVMGDQAKLHQLIAVPSGSKFTQTKPAAFDAKFPEYLMRRTCAGHGIVPQDIGLIEDVNRANGETQTDIQFRVNTLPWVLYVQDILTQYLQCDIGLRVQVKLDTGREVQDRLAEAQAHQLYVEMGAESPDEVRSEILGLPIDKERPTPRFFATQRIGPVPLLAIEGVAGRTDPETFGPAQDQPVLDQPFVPPVGVIPTPGTTDDKAALNATDQYQVYERRALESEQSGGARETPAQRDARGAKAEQDRTDADTAAQPSAGQQGGAKQATAKPGQPAAAGAKVAKSLDGDEAGELLAFRAFTAVRKRRGSWDRDFDFQHVAPAIARSLNRGARAEVIKAAGKPAALEHADPVARKVYDQLLEDFPPDAIRWVLDQTWDAEQLPPEAVDWDHVHTWTATHQPQRVAKLAKKMAKGGANRRAIAIARPGKPTVMLADGHHHAEAHKLLGEPVPAFVAHVAKVKGPWDEMHSSQDPDADVMKTAAAVPGLTKRSGMISLDLKPGTVPTVPGGPADHHITIVYLGPDVDDDAFWRACARARAAAASMTGPVSGTVQGVGTFTPSAGSGGMTPAFAQVDVPGAHVLRAHLADLSASEHTDYHPHVTLKYLAEGEPTPDPVPATAVTFTHLAVHRGGQVVHIPLGPPGQPVAKAGADPKASGQSTSADDWPGWQYDLHAADYWAPRLAAALAGAIDVHEIAQQWLHAHSDKQHAADTAALSVLAVGWLAAYRAAFIRTLTPLVAEIETDGYAIGTASAQALVTDTGVVLGEWEPGRTEDAERVILEQGDPAGLRALFAAAQESIGLMADSRIEAIGRLLAEAAERGDSAGTLGAALRALLADPARARRLALDQLTRGSGAGATAVYARNSVATHQWITDSGNVCVVCLTNADQGPVPIGFPFLSGDLGAPAHPDCRCATVPGPTHGR